MSIKKLSNLLDSNPIQSKSSKKTNIEPENSIESDPLKPERTREFELYSNDVINLFWPDLKKLNDHGMDETDYFSLPETAQLRLERIFKLYLTREFSLTNINKIKLRTNELDKSTSFRIFVILEGDKYLVFLLDPLHLVVTDKRTREKKVFKNNKGNGTCMSKYLK